VFLWVLLFLFCIVLVIAQIREDDVTEINKDDDD